ncbi:MAG TPA: AAA family ATPase [Gemmatimonadaceae bacterium]|nr:AAA family ATPase [Gemmatimonadaceae bacterium]
MIKVVITGSESTGKTQLAHQLGRHYDAPVSEEFVRSYVQGRSAPLSFGDHGPIARGQIANEDAAIARAKRLVILDTDLVSTVVYCTHYFSMAPQWIVDAARARAGSLYLLLRPDVPWIPDGVRDRGERREEMHALFAGTLSDLRLTPVEIGGDWDARFASAVRAIDALLPPP